MNIEQLCSKHSNPIQLCNFSTVSLLVVVVSTGLLVKYVQSDSILDYITKYVDKDIVLTEDQLQTVTFTLYSTDKKGWNFTFQDFESQNFLDHGFDPNRASTKVVIHGHTDDGFGETEICPTFLQAYAEAETLTKINFICVDWSILANQTIFKSAVSAINLGQVIGEKLVSNLLLDQLEQDPLKIHLIGHSLGAQMSGHIGRQTKKQTGQVLGRITGLDPANIFFEQVPAKMISKQDAKLVDIIHTNGGDFLTGDYGIAQAIGTVDFYPNGGEYMPGCEHDHLSQRKFSTLPGRLYQFAKQNMVGRKQNCHHMTAYGFYYVDSIKHAQKVDYFQATLCPTYEKYFLGECDQNDKLPMGEALTLEM